MGIGGSFESTAQAGMFRCVDPKLAAASQARRFNWLHLAAMVIFCGAIAGLIFLWGSISPGMTDTSHAHLAVEPCSSPQGAGSHMMSPQGAGSHMSRLLREA